MTEKRTRQDFIEFLDWLSDRGIMPKATVAARKAAVNRVLGILTEEEARDVTKLDLDSVMRRFTNLEGKGYTPGSLTTYLSRLRSALEDFTAYLDDPLNFRPSAQTRERRSTGKKETAVRTGAADAPAPQPASPNVSANTLSIPIRPDTTIVVMGLPYDLSDAEASKIANVIRAMATPIG
jgi:hypothetical protein